MSNFNSPSQTINSSMASNVEQNPPNSKNNGLIGTPKVHALIVAAGTGSRFGSKTPKQYTVIKNRTVLEHSVKALSASQYINQVFLVVSASDNTANTLDFDLPIQFATGGAERWQSVQNGVQEIVEVGGRPDDLVLIHDAARPCVLVAHIDEVVEVASNEQYGAILGVPVADTIKKIAGNVRNSGTYPTIDKTIDRACLWQAQTPQVFRLGALQSVLSEVAEKGLTITDESSAFEMMGYAVRLVKGSPQNLKLTYASDLILIEQLLKNHLS